MIIDEKILKDEEKIVFGLRTLYSDSGYRKFKMSKFEEYDLYMKNKDFLISDGIITFNDTNGKLLALKPDVTLSIVKNSKDIPGRTDKLFYNENVYRISDSSHTYKEIMQTGIECIGDIKREDVIQVVRLAKKSASIIKDSYHMVVSDIDFAESFFADYGIDRKFDKELCDAFFEKNTDILKAKCTIEQFTALSALMESYNDANDAKSGLLRYCISSKTKEKLYDFTTIFEEIFESDRENISIDFSLSNSTGYYSGIVFKCYISGIATPVISGGEYNGLMKKLGRNGGAIGFAVYLDELEHLDDALELKDEFVNVALPKGRLGEKVYEMFEKAGYECPAIKEQNRKLIFENSEKKVRYFWVKPSDVAIYVERGAADIGVAGYDILLEYSPDVYDLCDLQLGKCRMAVAAKKGFIYDDTKTLRVATKFSNIARSFYGEKCRDIDIIHLNGSIEIAPILGLSDVIVDIVETGKTLLENNLEPVEDIVNISARLISNKSSYRFKKEIIENIRKSIAEQVKKS
ncbi:MAG: ATP phosphoribosyltransferase [Clostridia bacterium]|nr:ATP phosphoribosyltransferase [Clostridia bacterium]